MERVVAEDRPAREPRGPAILLAAAFGVHAAAAVFWLSALPQGFPVGHPRFLANTAAPPVVLGLALAGVVLAGRSIVVPGTSRALEALALALPAGWGAGAVAARLAFPRSAAGVRPWVVLGLALALGAVLARRRPGPGGLVGAAVLLGAALGVLYPLAQRASVVAGLGAVEHVLGPGVRVDAARGVVSVVGPSLALEVRPLLTFESRSPDGCWTLLAPRESFGESRTLVAGRGGEGEVACAYRDDRQSTLRVRRAPSSPAASGPTATTIEAVSRLERPVFSHLNGFVTLLVRGHRQLSVSFSPCPAVPISFEPSDYPVGRPERVAYRDAAGTFHVVEATSGEKGPFRELASGPLGDGPLALTLLDSGRPVGRVVLEDWAAQASVALSPTAGWGLPENALELRRLGDALDAPCAVLGTLAATSVGRGWDSVGHAAGTYRNRIRIEPGP